MARQIVRSGTGKCIYRTKAVCVLQAMCVCNLKTTTGEEGECEE